MNSTRTTRRDFLGKTIVTGAGIAAGLRAATFGGVAKAAYNTGITATVGITKGADRADNAFRAMQLFKNQIASGDREQARGHQAQFCLVVGMLMPAPAWSIWTVFWSS